SISSHHFVEIELLADGLTCFEGRLNVLGDTEDLVPLLVPVARRTEEADLPDDCVNKLAERDRDLGVEHVTPTLQAREGNLRIVSEGEGDEFGQRRELDRDAALARAVHAVGKLPRSPAV